MEVYYKRFMIRFKRIRFNAKSARNFQHKIINDRKDFTMQ